VTTLSPSQVYQYLIGAGFSPAGATTMTAIAQAESSNNDKSLGDLNLQTSVWGPSFGLFQIRTLKQKTGTGDVRDINWLVSDANQAKAALSISNGGTDFSAWTTFTNGAYRRFLGTAQSAGTTNAQNAGLSLDALNPMTYITGARNILLEGLFVILGVGLVGAGLARAFKPQIDAAKGKAEQGAKVAASVVAPEAAPAIAASGKGK
jgi:hypothetical protein